MSRNPAYNSTASSDFTTYQFTSTSTEKTIEKRIEYSYTNTTFANGKMIYNLGFGDLSDDGKIVDSISSNNGDIVKVIATVIASLYEFTSQYPDRCVFFHGSDEKRTKFYRNVMCRHHAELTQDYHIYGIIDGGNEVTHEIFDVKRDDYVGFIVERKLNVE